MLKEIRKSINSNTFSTRNGELRGEAINAYLDLLQETYDNVFVIDCDFYTYTIVRNIPAEEYFEDVPVCPIHI